jgi:hypothetical protein
MFVYDARRVAGFLEKDSRLTPDTEDLYTLPGKEPGFG